MGNEVSKQHSEFDPELYPNDFHICYNGRYNKYGSIIHDLPFKIIGEQGKETEIGKYDVCTRCGEILKLTFNDVLNETYRTNVHKLFQQRPKSTFFFKDEVMSGRINPDTIPEENESWKDYLRRFTEFWQNSVYKRD